jgi:hypothetical protein
MPLPFLVGPAIVSAITTAATAAAAAKVASTVYNKSKESYSNPTPSGAWADAPVSTSHEPATEKQAIFDIDKEVALHTPTIENRLSELKQSSPSQVQGDMEAMMQLLSVNESNLQYVESQGWFKRIWGTVSGGNKRLEKMNAQNLQVVQKLSLSLITKLEQQNMLTREIISMMNEKINELAVGQVEFKEFIEAVLNRVADRFERVEDNMSFLYLLKEIDKSFFNQHSASVNLLRVAQELKAMWPIDEKQLRLLEDSMKEVSLITAETRTLDLFLKELGNMSEAEQASLSPKLIYGLQQSSHPVCYALGMSLAFGLEDMNKRKFKRFEPTLELISKDINISVELSSTDLFEFLLEWLNEQ